MIYTLTLNPSLDYMVTVPELTYGAVNRASKERIVPGGKGINVSMVLENLGFENTAMGFLAGFTGKELRRRLEEQGIRAKFIYVEQGMTRINVKIHFNEETEINGQGPCIKKKDIQKLYKQLDILKDGDILIISGSIPDSLPKTIYMDILEHLKEKRLYVVVDATQELLVNVLAYKPFLVKPNHHELGELFDVTIQEKADALKYAQKLQEMGARNVLVSMAGKGAVLVSDDGGIYEANAPEGVVINSVGAGDSMVAGFLAGYIESRSYPVAFQMSVCTGSASAFSEELTTRKQVMELMKENKDLFA